VAWSFDIRIELDPNVIRPGFSMAKMPFGTAFPAENAIYFPICSQLAAVPDVQAGLTWTDEILERETHEIFTPVYDGNSLGFSSNSQFGPFNLEVLRVEPQDASCLLEADIDINGALESFVFGHDGQVCFVPKRLRGITQTELRRLEFGLRFFLHARLFDHCLGTADQRDRNAGNENKLHYGKFRHA
jgi:hypothetical protein